MASLEVYVARVDDLTPGIRRFELRSGERAVLPPYGPGAHIEIQVTLSNGRPGLRAYSLVNPAAGSDYYEIAVQRESGGTGGSKWMHELRMGAKLTIEAPLNRFELAEDATDHVLIGGGIGITPLLCMARWLAENDGTFALHYAARNAESMAYRAEVEAMPQATTWFDGGNPENGMPLADVIGKPAEQRHLYVCGPKGLTSAVLETAKSLGWRESSLHYEHFAGSLDAGTDGEFTVELLQSGKTLLIPPGKSILDEMLAAGLDPLFDCRRGGCGVCMSPVVDGVPDHRDNCLTESEKMSGNTMCICVSRAKGDKLVLDI